MEQSGRVEGRICKTSGGDVLYLRTRVAGLELYNATYDATVAKVNGDIVRMSARRDEDISGKSAALREHDVAQVQFREGESDFDREHEEFASDAEA